MPLSVDARVGEFRISRLIGEGAMGEVYLAQDTILGRRIALKLLKPALLNRDGLARFMEEARTTASFNHPNIVALHSYGEFEGRPYLALEHVDGESLRARIQQQPLAVQEALRYARSIAEALVEAHRANLVHADLKPENVVVGRDGRVRVVDFGLAKITDNKLGAASGTPAYMAPERWRGSTPTGAIDIWSLGILLHELVVGRRPIPDSKIPELAFSKAEIVVESSSWGDLVRDCLVLDPAKRPTAEQLVARLTALLDERAASQDESRSPFRGLASFARGDADAYFGRDGELDALVEHMRDRPLVPITGPSGVGKTSFVRAALMPRLEQRGRWIFVEWRPGANPFGALAAALEAAGCAVPPGSLREHPDSLSLRLRELARSREARILVYVDQAEELFTLATNDAAAMCDCLATAAFSDEPWHVVMTVRDDFLVRLATSQPMRAHMGAVFPLFPMSVSDLRAAIVRPLEGVGYAVDDPELISRIVGDVQGQPACLPLLQFACASLWDRRDPKARMVRAREYDAIGGATGALASHADQFLSNLSTDEVRLARGILLALVNADGTRRPRARDALLEALAPGSDRILDRLLERRLVVSTRDLELDVPRIELAHESLSTAWPQLARWLDETHEERVLVAEIEQAAGVWQRRGRRDAETWADIALADAMRKIEMWNVELPSQSRAFLDASVTNAARGRRRRRVLAALVITALALAALGATVAAIVIARRKRDAEARQIVERLIAADRGVFELQLVPFDWDPVQQIATAPREHPRLHWRLRSAEGARVYDGDDLARGNAAWNGDAWIERVEARSGRALLEIDRACGPSVIALRSLPGYHERSKKTVVRIRVPTCNASSVDTVIVPAGPFVANVDADHGESAVDEPATLPQFAIDRTEVTRGAFAVYEEMVGLTGESAAPLPNVPALEKAGPRLPVVGVSYETARGYCRFLGKDLPTIEQWQKTVRGGRELADGPNPQPERQTPWITTTSSHPTNVSYDPSTEAVAPVASFPDDRSPYGVFDLAGNVLEWTLSRPPSTSRMRDLRIVAGASWATPASTQRYEVRWRNTRPDRYLDFTLGFRCAR